jgi:hypothetical protein
LEQKSEHKIFLKRKKRKISNKVFEQTCEIIIHKNENKKIFGKIIKKIWRKTFRQTKKFESPK